MSRVRFVTFAAVMVVAVAPINVAAGQWVRVARFVNDTTVELVPLRAPTGAATRVARFVNDTTVELVPLRSRIPVDSAPRQAVVVPTGHRRAIVGGIVGAVIGGLGSAALVLNSYGSQLCVAQPSPGGGTSPCEQRNKRAGIVVPVVIVGGTAGGAALGSWIARQGAKSP